MGWIAKIFGRKKRNEQKLKPLSIGEMAEANADIVSDWRLSVTMNIRTPLEWLRRHGEIAKTPSKVPSEYGIWVLKTKSWRELVFDIDEIPEGTMASQIGQIPQDGGEFLSFLIEYRQIVELDQGRREMLAALDAMGAKHRPIVRKLGAGKLSRQFVEAELLTLPGCGKITAQRLYDGKFRSADEVRSASVERLTTIPGIGKATAAKLIG